MNKNTFGYFFRKIWWWNILLDMLLISLEAYYAFKVWTDKQWEHSEYTIQWFRMILSLPAAHSLLLIIFSFLRFKGKNYASSILLLLHAAILLAVVFLLMNLILLRGIN